MNSITMTTDSLADLAVLIRLDISRREESKEHWVEATLDLCRHLADARAEFKGDAEFGRWFEESRIKLNKDERAAAIHMGEDIDRAREILLATDRRSLKQIHDKEFRILHVEKAKKPQKPKPPTEEFERAMRVIERRAAAGEGLTYAEIEKEAGASSTPVRRALAAFEAGRASAAQLENLLNAPQREKLEAAMRAYKRRLDLEFEARVIEEARRRSEELSLPFYFEKLDKIERQLAGRSGVMPRREFRKILACLHPDMARPGQEQRFEEAFRIFNGYEIKLVSDDKLAVTSHLPHTIEELLARKKQGTRR